MKRLLLTLFCLSCLVSPTFAAQYDTSFDFRTIETTHFSIHFHQGLEELADRTAKMAEEIHETLSRELLWQPAEKTQVVLIDDSDFANGMATVLPYNVIFLQTVPPALDSTIGEYDDWLRILFVHEYTHILTMDPERGYSRVLRRIFGKPLPGVDALSLLAFIAASPPNVFLPRWWHEGIATWSESQNGAAGRGRSSTYEMILRTAVFEKNLPPVDAINGDVPDWPNGHLPYIFGLRLTKYITDRFGTAAPGKLSSAHAGRFPYFISAPAEEISGGRDYVALYQGMLTDLEREQGERIRRLQKMPFTPHRILRDDGENLSSPRFSPDGTLIAYTRHDPHGHTEVVVTDNGGREKRGSFRRQHSDNGLSWAPDGSGLYYSQAEIRRGFNIYEDLYYYDLDGGRVKRLTRGLRLREPELSPDGTTFAVVVSSRGSQNLALLDAAEARKGKGAKSLTPVSSYRFRRVATPRWSPDGRMIAYALTAEDGRSGIWLYDTTTRNNRPLITGPHDAAYPVWSRDGRTIFYVSDETGVFNIFARPLGEAASFQVSHLVGGAVQPDISPDGSTLIFSSYSSRGYKVAAMAAAREGWLSERSPAITPYWKEESIAAKPEIAAAEPPEASPYSPWRTLLPRFWLPTLASDSDDTVIAGAFTAGSDVLGHHSYLAELAWGEKFKRPYYSLTYKNDLFYPSFLFQGYDQQILYSDLMERGDYYEENRGLVARISVPLNFLESRYRFFFGYHLQDQQALGPLVHDPVTGEAVFQGRRDNVFAGLEFDNTLKYPYSISREEGRTLSFLYRRYARKLGSDIEGEEYVAGYTEYLRLPGQRLRHHVIQYNLKGGVASGERTLQQAFQLGGNASLLNAFPLRGYPSRFETGKYIVTGSIEYRSPAWYFERGFGTKPIFLEKLHHALFVDAGEVWDETRSFRGDRLKVGAGIEARLDLTLGYLLKITPAIGYAHGFDRGGEDQVYITIYANL